MKAPIFFLFLAACLFQACTEQLTPNWEVVYEGGKDRILAVKAVNDSLLFAAGGFRYASELTIRSTDAGTSWEPAPPLFDQTLYDIDFLPPSYGVAVGVSGKLLRTWDGGETWKLYQQYLWRNFRAVTLVDDTLAIAVGGAGYDEGIIIRSTNAGRTWDLVDTLDYELRDVVFTDAQTGYATGYGVIFKTNDGGLTWALTEAAGDFFSAISFPTDQIGYAVGRAGTILKTEDAGQTWQTLRNGDAVTKARHFYNDVLFLDPETGYIVGDKGLLLKTADGGDRWTKFERNETVDFFSISMVREGLGYIGGDEGKLIRFEE